MNPFWPQAQQIVTDHGVIVALSVPFYPSTPLDDFCFKLAVVKKYFMYWTEINAHSKKRPVGSGSCRTNSSRSCRIVVVVASCIGCGIGIGIGFGFGFGIHYRIETGKGIRIGITEVVC